MLELLSAGSLSMQGIGVEEGIEKVWVVGFVLVEGSTIDVQLQGSAETTRGTFIPRKKKLTKLATQGKKCIKLRVWSKCGWYFYFAIFQLRLGHHFKIDHKFEYLLRDCFMSETLFPAGMFYVAFSEEVQEVSSSRDMQPSTRLTHASCAHRMQIKRKHYRDPARDH